MLEVNGIKEGAEYRLTSDTGLDENHLPRGTILCISNIIRDRASGAITYIGYCLDGGKLELHLKPKEFEDRFFAAIELVEN